MPFAPFTAKFRELGIAETRVLTALNLPGVIPGEYALMELYCDEPGCDCRRVLFSVHRRGSKIPEAVIGYGWESIEFYSQWLGRDDPKAIREMQGPSLNPISPQSSMAPALLQQMPFILQDIKYVERLKRHYAMFRAEVEQGTGTSSRRQLPPKRRKASRKLR